MYNIDNVLLDQKIQSNSNNNTLFKTTKTIYIKKQQQHDTYENDKHE